MGIKMMPVYAILETNKALSEVAIENIIYIQNSQIKVQKHVSEYVMFVTDLGFLKNTNKAKNKKINDAINGGPL